MNQELLLKTCLGLELALADVEKSYRDFESDELFEINIGEKRYTSNENKILFEYHLNRCQMIFLVALDGLQLASTYQRLATDWELFKQKGLTVTQFLPDFDVLESPPLMYLKHILEGLNAMRSTEETAIEEYRMKTLMDILNDTACLVYERNKNPQKEHDVQHIMHDYLNAFFPDFTTNIVIPGSIKNFKPDSGIRGLRVAIEFKFANNKKEVSKALSGIFEDIAGYSGSRDWTKFISVVYMTGPWEMSSRFKSDLLRSGTQSWTPILVNGAGERANTSSVQVTPKKTKSNKAEKKANAPSVQAIQKKAKAKK